MDNENINRLVNLGLISNTQILLNTYILNIVFTINNEKYQYERSDKIEVYKLKKIITDEYLLVNNDKLSKTKINKIKDNSESLLFYIFFDNICVSFIPYNNINCILCVQNNILTVKKHIACINNNIESIFNVCIEKKSVKHDTNKHDTTNIQKPLVKKNDKLLEFNKLNPIKNLQFNWLKIVSNVETLPEPFDKYIDNKFIYVKSSYLYLIYIIENYENLNEMILFLDSYPIHNIVNSQFDNINVNIEKIILNSNKKDNLHLVDSRVNIEGTRLQYGIDGNWCEWTNVKCNSDIYLSQKQFWIHVLKLSPINRNIEYSSNNTRLINSNKIKQYPLTFYKNILFRIKTQHSPLLIYLDRCWDTIFR